jgi:two-component system NarL family sensor kinase
LYYQVNPDSSRYWNFKALEHAEKADDLLHRAAIENFIGLSHMYQKNYEEAIVWFKKSAKKMAEMNNKRNTAMLLNNIGASYNEMQQSSIAMKYFLLAQKIEWDNEHQQVVLLLDLNLGNVYQDLGQDSLALDHYHKSLSLTDPETDPYNHGLNQHNIGVVLFMKDQSSKEGLARQKIAHEIASTHEYANLATMSGSELANY